MTSDSQRTDTTTAGVELDVLGLRVDDVMAEIRGEMVARSGFGD
jgi:hypothetical protein